MNAENNFKEMFLGRNYVNLLKFWHWWETIHLQDLHHNNFLYITVITTFSDIWNYFLDWYHGTRFRLETRTCSFTRHFVFIRRHYRSSFNFLFRGIVFRNKRLKHNRIICWLCFMMHCKSSLFHPIFILFISFRYYVYHTACFRLLYVVLLLWTSEMMVHRWQLSAFR